MSRDVRADTGFFSGKAVAKSDVIKMAFIALK